MHNFWGLGYLGQIYYCLKKLKIDCKGSALNVKVKGSVKLIVAMFSR